MYKMRILDAKQVRGLISMDDAIKGVREAYKLYSTGKAGLWPIITHDFKTGCSDMDIKSGYMEDAGIYGLKILGWNKDNTKLLGTPALAGLIVVMDIERQQPTGILEGTPVTSYRTGAAGAVAAQLLANPESEKAVIVGAGAQGRAQLLGLSKVMKNLKSVAVIDKTAEAAESMVKEVSTDYPQLTLSAQPFGSMEKFVREADIVVTCTPSRTLLSNPLSPEACVRPPKSSDSPSEPSQPRSMSSASSITSRLWAPSTCEAQIWSAANRFRGSPSAASPLRLMSWTTS